MAKLTSSKAKEILRDGTAQGHSLTPKQKRYFGYIAGGGKPKAEDGTTISQISSNMSSNPIHEFRGPSHEQGGIDISYHGTPVEVEGGETSFVDRSGDMHVMGNMYFPGSRKKFKDISKAIAEKENKAGKLISEGSKLVNNNDPKDKWGRLKFNSGRIMAMGGKMKQDELTEQKEHLVKLQKAMLDVAEEHGLDPKHLSEGKFKSSPKSQWGYAADGTSIDGDGQSLAQRNNNPGNLEYHPWMKKYGARPGESHNGHIFAKFPDVKSGQSAMRALVNSDSYKNLTVDQAIDKWTGKQPYNKELWKDLAGKKVGELSADDQMKFLNVITKGEDSKKYNWEPPDRSELPPITIQAPPRVPTKIPFDYTIPDSNRPPLIPTGGGNTVPETKTPKQNGNPLPPLSWTRHNVPTNAKGLGVEDFLPEIYTAATNKEQMVRAQKYTPQLYTPYEVSFEDRLNENNRTFNALRDEYTGSPAALEQLAAQKYDADQQVLAEQFRTNQGIKNDVTNKNIALLNDAENENLKIADTQYERQSTARSKTLEQNRVILDSIASKYAQNELENRTLKAYESRSNFRFNDQGQLVNYNPDQVFFGSGVGVQSPGPGTSRSVTYDASGNPVRTTERTQAPSQTEYQEGRIWQQNYDKTQQSLTYAMGGVLKLHSETKKLRW
jgi:hypothetical protein